MEQFRKMGEVIGSMKAQMLFQEHFQINKRQCSLLFDLFNIAFHTIAEDIKQTLKLDEKNTKWKALEQPLRELCRVFMDGDSYIRGCSLETKGVGSSSSSSWWAKALVLHCNKDCIEFHIHNLLSNFPMVIEAIETAGEISGVDLDEMVKRRIMLANKYNEVWNDSKLFRWKYGKQYLVSEEIINRLDTAWKEDGWLLYEAIRDSNNNNNNNRGSSISRPRWYSVPLTKYEQQLCELLTQRINGSELLFPSSYLTGAPDYKVRKRLSKGSSQYMEVQWLGETFALRRFYGEAQALNSEVYSVLSLSHPNVVQYLCGFHDKDKKEYLFVMELMNKDLETHIKELSGPKKRLPFSLPVAVDIMLQIARGMEYLHSQKIYHGHLHPSNVLIKLISSPSHHEEEGYIHIKIFGFDLRSVVNTNTNTSPNPPSRRGLLSCPMKEDTPLPLIWYAPEVLAEQENPGWTTRPTTLKYTEKADVYAFGMLCFQVLTGKVPFEDGHLQGDRDKMGRNIRAGERPLFPFPLPKYLSTLTKRCWQTDPSQRPSFSSICRILRYIKRTMVMNPSHLAYPEIPSSPQVDLCDVDAGLVQKLSLQSSTDPVRPVWEIPYEMFACRLAEKEKLSGDGKDKRNWESASEGMLSTAGGENKNNTAGAEDPFPHTQDARSVFSETPNNKRGPLLPHLRRSRSMAQPPNSLLITQVSRPLQLKGAQQEKKKPAATTSWLKRSVSAATPTHHRFASSLPIIQDSRSVCSEITNGKRNSLLRQSSIETRSVCLEIPEHKTTRTSNLRASRDTGKLNTTKARPSVSQSHGRMKIGPDRHTSVSGRECRCDTKSLGH